MPPLAALAVKPQITNRNRSYNTAAELELRTEQLCVLLGPCLVIIATCAHRRSAMLYWP